jgi:hypothetical protein
MVYLKKTAPYLLVSLLVIGIWRLKTDSENYAWFPKGKEQLMLDIALARIFIYKVFFWLILANSVFFAVSYLVKRNYKIGALTTAFAVLFYCFTVKWVEEKCAISYCTVFHNQSVSEEYLQDPIKEAGYSIGPLLTASIGDKNMKFRRYAISALGDIHYAPAIPVLRSIAFNPNELDYIRADAREAIISLNEGDTAEAVNKLSPATVKN